MKIGTKVRGGAGRGRRIGSGRGGKRAEAREREARGNCFERGFRGAHIDEDDGGPLIGFSAHPTTVPWLWARCLWSVRWNLEASWGPSWGPVFDVLGASWGIC
eukprot:5240106-Pyramimonas_sp.AAC.1